MIYTTNAIESLNSVIRHAIKSVKCSRQTTRWKSGVAGNPVCVPEMDSAIEGLAYGNEPLYYRVRWPPERSLLKKAFTQNPKQVPTFFTHTKHLVTWRRAESSTTTVYQYDIGLLNFGIHQGISPIFPDSCYHLTHYWSAATYIPAASDNLELCCIVMFDRYCMVMQCRH